jgi:hypothetical protein
LSSICFSKQWNRVTESKWHSNKLIDSFFLFSRAYRRSRPIAAHS